MEDDPLFALSQDKPTASKPQQVVFGAPSPAATESLRGIDASKLKDKPLPKAVSKPAPATASAPAAAVPELIAEKTKGSAKGLGFGVDLWGSNDTSSSIFSSGGSPLKDKSGDFLSDVTASEPVTDAGIFRAATGGGVEKVMSTITTTTPSKVRVGLDDVDETKLHDLNVEKLLEREEELDYATFGKSGHAVQLNQKKVVASVQASREKGDFDLESTDVLAKLEAATLERDDEAKLYRPSSSTSPSVEPAEVVNVDLNAMDLNAYIRQQEEGGGGGGGLFD